MVFVAKSEESKTATAHIKRMLTPKRASQTKQTAVQEKLAGR